MTKQDHDEHRQRLDKQAATLSVTRGDVAVLQGDVDQLDATTTRQGEEIKDLTQVVLNLDDDHEKHGARLKVMETAQQLLAGQNADIRNRLVKLEQCDQLGVGDVANIGAEIEELKETNSRILYRITKLEEASEPKSDAPVPDWAPGNYEAKIAELRNAYYKANRECDQWEEKYLDADEKVAALKAKLSEAIKENAGLKNEFAHAEYDRGQWEDKFIDADERADRNSELARGLARKLSKARRDWKREMASRFAERRVADFHATELEELLAEATERAEKAEAKLAKVREKLGRGGSEKHFFDLLNIVNDIALIVGNDTPAPRTWHAGDPEPEGVAAVKDKDGDVFYKHVNGTWGFEDREWEWSGVLTYEPLTEVVE